MGRRFRAWLDGSRVYGCSACGTHVADADDIVSKVSERRGCVFFWAGGNASLGRAQGAPACPRGRPPRSPAACGVGTECRALAGPSRGAAAGAERVGERKKKGAPTRVRSGARKRRRSAFLFNLTHPHHPQAFQGRHGRAYLFHTVVNVTHGPKEERLLITGLHTVRSAMCVQCAAVLGWTYVHAYEPSQQYKQGKTILEKAMITAEDAGGGLSS